MQNIELTLLRTINDDDSTGGVFYIDGDPYCFTCEDQYQETKVKGETRIPEGRYEVKLRKVESGLTRRYRKRYPWFTYHLHLQNVPGFNYIYIHIGNDDNDTDGCILLGMQQRIMDDGSVEVYSSRDAFKPFYLQALAQLEDGNRMFITVKST